MLTADVTPVTCKYGVRSNGKVFLNELLTSNSFPTSPVKIVHIAKAVGLDRRSWTEGFEGFFSEQNYGL